MANKRPCRLCRRWFRVHPRAGARQRVCSSPSCQRERHRRACQEWHRRNPGYDREERLRRRLRRGSSADRRLDWSVARDAVGLEVVVVIEEAAKDLQHWARDAVRGQGLGPATVGR